MEASALVEAAKGGDPQAFDALVRRYRSRIFALALHLTGSRSEADDITQDAFLRAYRNIGRFEGRSEFFTWLYRIALNRALNIRRDRKRRITMSIDDPRLTMALAVDAGNDPRRTLELRETYTLLLRAFDALSPLLRTTVVLTLLQGFSYKEAAVVLDTTEGTIAWRVHEARRKMRDVMAKMLKDPTPVERVKVAELNRQRRQEESPRSLESALASLVMPKTSPA
ncbi:MAG TPA: RNA polymerase sigma factor [Sandaracinaceae bacterium LLY-WYZ-13_1]|nr:RNA polymerase sigma factor [Sandaracinaceae bacterium LLY-WYZ-13_1]